MPFFCHSEAGETPEHIINQLTQIYSTTERMANIISDWLVEPGVEYSEVQELFESDLKKTCSQKSRLNFHWRRFSDGFDWTQDTARSYVQFIMVKLLSDIGYQSEISSISTAAQQLEVFAWVLKTSPLKYYQTNKAIRNLKIVWNENIE